MERVATCKAERKDGSPCQSQILLPSGLCHLHDPDRQDSVQAARAVGGQHRANAHRLRRLMAADIRPVFDLIVEATRRTYDGELDPKVLSALAAGVSAACKAYETGMVEDRLNAIGERLGEQRA
jgi:hypothetical protein